MNGQPAQTGAAVPEARGSLPSGIWALGLVSLCMDTSSELIHSLLPVFMASVLGASMATIGIIEGVAEATAAITRIFSGVFSDWLGKRKALVVLGYGLSTLTKPIFPLATSIGWVFGARFADRVGKGIRTAPRDALVADMVPAQLRGAAYGLRQALDSVGAFLGPMLALLGMMLLADSITSVLWIGVVPAVAAVLLLIFAVHEPERTTAAPARGMPIRLVDARRLGLDFWLVVLLGAVFTMARFSEAFLILRAQSVHLPMAYVPVVMVIMNVVYAAVSYPAGLAADRLRRRTLLLAGLAMLILADLVLAMAGTPLAVFAGVGLWGLHMGVTQGLFSKLVADSAPGELRGTAFGLFNLINGVALLLASALAGLLWDRLGPAATFIAGGSFATIAALGILFHRSRSSP
ncbi:MAG TPA: MFS transporter [Mariprofundaceae bacterium]|nr:MFS transporter [Mariprofundaceae bacterium]